MILGLLLILSSLLVYFELVQPAYNEAQHVKAQKNGLQTFLDSEKIVVTRVQQLMNSYEGQLAIQKVVSDVLPASRDIAGALAQFYGLAQNNGLSSRSFGISVAPTSQRKNAAITDIGISQVSDFATSLQKGFNSISFELQLDGSYENLKSFLSALETNIRIFDVQKVEFRTVANIGTGKSGGASEPADLFSYSVVVKTYYQNK